MHEPVAPRTYKSDLRARQAEQTRRRIVDAAATQFATNGYQATTMAAIAREAGTSTETVKSAASKAELLLAAFEVTFSGSEDAESLADTEVGDGILDLPDAVFLSAVLDRIASANARGHALWTVVLGAAMSDPQVGAALDVILTRRRADYRMLTGELMRRGIAPADLDVETTSAAASFLLSPEGYQQLVAQSGWTEERYRQWLEESIARLLKRAG